MTPSVTTAMATAARCPPTPAWRSSAVPCSFLEASVCTHSIPVGLSLGLQGGDNFITLFIAVVIHQVRRGAGAARQGVGAGG